MSDNDEIKPGDRFERVGGACFSFRNGDICTALRPAVLVGPEVGWLIEGSEKLWYLDDPTLWQRLPRTEAPAVKVEATSPDAIIRHALQLLETGRLVGPHWWNAVDEPLPAPPPRCKPGCTPREPCRSDVCPAFDEESIGDTMGEAWGAKGISADALPPARVATYQPRCAELSGWGSWNGRARK